MGLKAENCARSWDVGAWVTCVARRPSEARVVGTLRGQGWVLRSSQVGGGNRTGDILGAGSPPRGLRAVMKDYKSDR